MALAQLTIKTAAGNKLAVLTGGIVSLASGNSGIAIATSGNRITISSVTEKTIYDEAFAVISLTPNISKINGINADSFGAFFIHGSGCWDWYYKDVTASGTPDIRRGALILNDLCSSCTGCESQVRLKKLAEYMKTAFNILKDANLYDASVVESRKKYLEQHMLRVSENCSNALTEEDNNRISSLQVFGNRLLGEYLTLVHMWNYLVSTNSDTTEIRQASDDASAMSVTTEATQADCKGTTNVVTTITVSQVSGQAGLSLYVPDATTALSDKSATNSMTSTISYATPTTVVVTGETSEASASTGIYGLSFSCYPYFNVTIQTADADGTWQDTTVDNWTPEKLDKSVVPDGVGGDTVTYNGLKLRLLKSQTTTPTKEAYIQSKTVPSKIETGSNLWKVTTTIKKTGTLPTASSSTYYYETPYVPIPTLTGMDAGLSLNRIIAP